MRKWFPVLILLLLLALVLPAAAETQNLLENGGFETFSADGIPDGWTPYVYADGYSVLTVSSAKAHSGQYSACIENKDGNDARFMRTVFVEPSSLYKLSAYIWVEEMAEGGNGANLALEGLISTSEKLKAPTDGWQYVEWYGETSEDQDAVTFGVRVGGYGRESTGKAYFDDVTFEKVDSLPKGVAADTWYQEIDPELEEEETSGAPDEEDPFLKNLLLILSAAVIFLILFVLFLPFTGKKDLPPSMLWLCFAVVMLAGLLIRLVLSLRVEGYSVDIGCFTAWSQRMAQVGPKDFYAADYFCDYPPFGMLILYPVGLLLKAFNGSPSAQLLIVKGYSVLFDLLGAAFLFGFGRKEKKPVAGLVCALLFLLNPAVLVTGAAWGQMDSVLSFFLLLTAFFAMKKEWRAALPLYVLSVLLKPQALLVGPVGLAWFVCCVLRAEKEERGKQFRFFGIGCGIALACAAAVLAPFMAGQKEPFPWLLGLYGGTLSSYNYASVNAANLFYLLGANWKQAALAAPIYAEIILSLLFASAGVFLMIRKRGDQKRTAFSVLFFAGCLYTAMLAVFRGSFGMLGYGLLAFVYLFVFLCMVYGREKGNLPFLMAVSFCGIFCFSVKVHERYMFCSLALLLLAYLLSGDRRLLILAAGFSVSTYLNTAVILNNSILYGSSYGHLTESTQWLNLFLCAANLGLTVWAGCIAFTGLRKSATFQKNESVPDTQAKKERIQAVLDPSSRKIGLRGKDWLIMGAVTVLYAALCFTNLGSTSAPQTYWQSVSSDEEIVLELEEESTFSLLYYAGVSRKNFSVSVSADGQDWGVEIPCQMNEGQCYRWMYAVDYYDDDGDVSFSSAAPDTVLWMNGRYIRIRSGGYGFNLWEVVARDEDGNNLPMRVVSHTGMDEDPPEGSAPEHLVDEMDTCAGEPGWYTGTYFDEIYHVRTAYEHLHGQSPYETSHPPLGKLLIAGGIALFGMTPFGWRFAGALCGVLMLPALYLFVLQLTRKRSAAAASMTAFALDLMHFTQTRIATIDSFPVLFIILSYLFMVRYLQSDFFAVPEKEGTVLLDRTFLCSLIPLFFSGLFMGLGIASKWIGIYSAMGLAVLFLVGCVRKAVVSLDCWEVPDDDPGYSPEEHARLNAARGLTVKRLLITCCFCVIFFIVIPCMIYYCAYIPYFAPDGGVTLQKIIDAQVGMFSYHSTPGLGMDHPFYSPWWHWPLLLKPMWYCQERFEPAGLESTLFCMGNPSVFVLGLLAMLAVLGCLLYRVSRRKPGPLSRDRQDLRVLIVLSVGYLAQYLPWILVPRGMYMYHYFASVPFFIAGSCWLISRIGQKKTRRIAWTVYLALAAAGFVLFFPYASGLALPRGWMEFLRKLFGWPKCFPFLSDFFNLYY